jgi:hypothetical protein
MRVVSDLGDGAVGVIQYAVGKDIQQDIGIFGNRTGGKTQGTLLKATTERFVENKRRSLDVVRTKDAGTNAFLDRFLDEMDVS